jgi:hypothetical protein
MTQHLELFTALAAPFAPEEVKVRSQAGRGLPYITARTIMNRLDEVLGPENWWDEYVPLEHSVICRLTVRLPDGKILTKCDAGGYAGMADPGDDDKSGFADAFKRAAVKFGVGRYLYRDGVPRFARPAEESRPNAGAPVVERQSAQAGSASRRPSPPAADLRDPAAKPPAASESGSASRRPSPPPAELRDPAAKPPVASDGPSKSASASPSPPPRTGRALFSWAKKQEEEHGYGLLKHLSEWAKSQEFPARIVDWDAEQVAGGYDEACRKLRALQSAATAPETPVSY